MKTFAWLVAIVISGMLLGAGIGHFAGGRDNGAGRTSAAAAIGDTLNPVQAGDAADGNYRVGDRLAQHTGAVAEVATVANGKPAAPAAVAAGSPYREILWDALLAPGWDPMLPFKGLKLDQMEDGDPRAMRALEKARKYWDKAPVNPALNDVAVRIPGFVVSLEREGDALQEFLVVPYYGGCIHVPPPPANQIIHVHSSHAIAGIRTMDAVWISGTIKVATSDTMMGVAGYSMLAQHVEPYRDQAQN